ncbi:MAG: filamentous hemagglutinin N-terminal domain-containing protein, partial [Acetobacteraceae bacterium]
NLGSAATVNFVQPSASAVTLNRVLAPDPSVIAGHIHANGGIVLTNPAGVVFTHGAEVNAASVLVSAPGITNRDFMAGRMRFDIPARPGARIVNAGHITVQAAGLAALVAPEVANSGVISAKLGHVILAGGAAAETLDLYGDGLVSLDVTPEAQKVRLANGTKATALVTNSGTIIASGGSVLLTARQADGLVQDLVDAGGTIAANSVGAHTGTIAIRGIGGSIRIPGTLLAQGKAPGTTGGVIALDATGTVTVADGARINASGAAGGGTVAIGTTLARARGGPGTAATLTARAVTVAPRAEIAADATASGNGGRVSVLSLGATRMAGTVTARGGPHGGNGGSVEISGENLSLDGRVDTSAPLGATGSILLDPYDLTIVSSGTSNTDVSATGVAFSAGGTAPGDTDTVSASAIEALSGNVTLQAIHDLEIATNLKLTGVNQSLTLQAGNDLKIDSGFLVSAPGAIEMDAASLASPTPNAAGAITVNGTVNATGALTLNAGSGGISVPGSISGDGLSLTTGGAIVVGGTASAGAGGSVSLSAGAGGIILNGSISGDAVVLTTPGSAFDASGAISAT